MKTTAAICIDGIVKGLEVKDRTNRSGTFFVNSVDSPLVVECYCGSTFMDPSKATCTHSSEGVRIHYEKVTRTKGAPKMHVTSRRRPIYSERQEKPAYSSEGPRPVIGPDPELEINNADACIITG